nr:zinc finger, CCHC-type [Tanacetum cinerariifolium]
MSFTCIDRGTCRLVLSEPSQPFAELIFNSEAGLIKIRKGRKKKKMAGDGSKNEPTKDSGTSMTFQCPVPNSTNYTIWAVKIKALFNVHGIWEAADLIFNSEAGLIKIGKGRKKKKMAGDGSKNEPTKDSGTSMTFQCPVLNSTNYTIWAVKIKALFNVHGIWEAVEPTTNAEVDQKKNNMAIAMLYQAIPENMVLQIASLTSAKEIWEALKVRHVGIERVKEARVQTIESGLGHTLEEKRQVRKLLGSVPEKFIQIVAAIEQFADLNTIVISRSRGETKGEDAKEKHHKCDHCGCENARQKDLGRDQGRGRGSGRSQGDGRAQRDKSNVKCFKCNELGHFSNECPKWENKRNEANLIQYEDDEPIVGAPLL